jgi:hypothetical protein
MPPLSLQEKAGLARMHLLKSVEIKGIPRGILEMRRHLTNYFKNLAHFKETRLKLVTSMDMDELLELIDWIPGNWTETTEI